MEKIQDYEALRHSVTVLGLDVPLWYTSPTLTFFLFFYIQNLSSPLQKCQTITHTATGSTVYLTIALNDIRGKGYVSTEWQSVSGSPRTLCMTQNQWL